MRKDTAWSSITAPVPDRPYFTFMFISCRAVIFIGRRVNHTALWVVDEQPVHFFDSLLFNTTVPANPRIFPLSIHINFSFTFNIFPLIQTYSHVLLLRLLFY